MIGKIVLTVIYQQLSGSARLLEKHFIFIPMELRPYYLIQTATERCHGNVMSSTPNGRFTKQTTRDKLCLSVMPITGTMLSIPKICNVWGYSMIALLVSS